MEHDLKPPADTRSAAPGTDSARNGKPQTKFWLLLGFLIATLLLVLLVLPSIVMDPDPAGNTQPVGLQQESVTGKLPGQEALEQTRTDAELALQIFLRLQAQPDLQNVAIWAAENWQNASNAAARGDEEFGQGSFSAALKAYQDAASQLQTTLDKREQILQTKLAAGWQFLQENRVNAATAAFEAVLAMQAVHQQAQLGLERAGVREQVLEIVTKAQQAEVSDTLEQAAEAYTLALQLDPLYLPAQEALQRLSVELRERAFRDAMGMALQALDKQQFALADQALTEAASLKPDDQTLKDSRRRLSSARRQASLNGLRKQAQALVQSEKWSAAVETYRRALKLDSKAAFAINGLSRAQKKQQLHQQLDHYLADTTRLYSDDPLDNAGKLLAANQQIAANEPILAEKLAALQLAVNLAVIPVDLLLLSDNLTQVSIYKVGRLGRFEQKQISLRPGKYTITGSRQGYRDVLKVFEVKPGSSGLSVKIQTEEQI